MFLSFESQDERRSFGGSAFAELRYCKLNPDTKVKKILSARSVVHWQEDSLYIYADDTDRFVSDYAEIFGDGIYGNLTTGPLDIYGINYYPPARLKDIILNIEDRKPSDWETLSAWLKKATGYNGFYVLGI